TRATPTSPASAAPSGSRSGCRPRRSSSPLHCLVEPGPNGHRPQTQEASSPTPHQSTHDADLRGCLRLRLRPDLLLKTGYIHAGTVVALADTSTGYGCRASLPEHSGGFTTIELKINLLGSAADGDELRSEALLVHGGQTTQVWDAPRRPDGRTVGVFRCI